MSGGENLRIEIFKGPGEVLGCFAIMAHSGILTWSSPHLAEHMGKLHCEHFSLGTSKKKKVQIIYNDNWNFH